MAKKLLWSTNISFCKRTATHKVVKAKVLKFVRFCFHAYLELSQGVKVFENVEQHHDKVLIPV